MNHRAAAAVALIALLAFSPQALAASGQASPPTASRTSDSAFVDHGIELMDSQDRITLSWLSAQTNGVLTVQAFEKVIQSSLLTLGVRKVLLDIGWQNYTVGGVQEQPWVSDWLAACDALGVQNLLYLGQLTQEGYGSTWAKSLIAADPSTQTYFSNGTAAPFVSVDNPDVAKAIEVDLQTLYSYYGSHPSWVGLGTGYPQGDPYFPANSTMPIMGYSNATLQAFANSPFFARDTNQSGFYGNGTGDLLASSFEQAEPSQLTTSGVWMTSSGEPVYGNQSTGNRVAMKFFLPKNESEMQLSWYGDQVGQAGSLVAQLVPDHNGTLVVGDAMATATEEASNITATAGWQAGVLFTGNFTSENYWVVFSSPSSDSENYVTVYMRDYQVGNYVSYFQQGVDKEIGYAVLWVRDGQGAGLEIYPYQNEYIPSGAQTFVASQSFSFNTVFLFLSDRDYNPINGTLIITDITDGGTVEATGVLSQAATHGLQNWTPVQLDKVVNTVPGDNYSISITEPQSGYSWSVVVRGVTTDPASAGFQGQSSYWLFRLDLMDWGAAHFSYSVITSNGADAVRSGHPDAIQFLPSQNETLEYTSLLMRNAGTENATYSSGSLTLGVWTTTLNGSQPLQELASTNITASKVPENGWLNSSSLHVSLVGSEHYWLVISTNSSSDFVLARLTSPYQSDVLVSDNGGRTWAVPAEGPSEYSYSLILSEETLGPAVSDVPQVELSPTSAFGQPIQVTAPTQVKGVYLGVFERQSSTAPPNDHLVVSIHPDNGKGEPSETSLASGVYYGDNITFYSPDYIQFTSVARLDPGQTYWIVAQPVGGNYYVFPDVYLARTPTASPDAMISNDAGFTWQRYSNQTTSLSYMLASPVHPSPTYNTTQLYQDLEKFHDFPVDATPPKGWPAYVQSSELGLENEVGSWLNQQTGHNWEVAVSAQPSLFNASDYSTLTPLPVGDPFTTCAASEQYLLTQAPVSNSQLYEVGGLQLLDGCTSFSMASFAQILGYLQFYPGGASLNASGTIWQTEGGSGQYPDLYYSINGRAGGPVVLWVSNAGSTASSFSLSLNATQLDLRNSWVVLGLTDSSITTGSGPTLTVQREIPADSWYPIIIGSYDATFVASYSDATIQRQLQYPDQGLYSTGASDNQSILMLISSSSPVGGVSVDAKTNLTSVTASSFYSSHEGWYYDASSGILLAKFQSSGNDTVRVLSASPPVVRAAVPPKVELAEVIAALFAIDLALVVYAAFAGRGRAARTEMEDTGRAPSH
ncbi:MAG: hypothetical protein OK456_06485 [Thaumarchaeota archaeon]|nr:hypothetical protein [Nitrososphaerota archaeon]